jgi:hypothetical protein
MSRLTDIILRTYNRRERKSPSLATMYASPHITTLSPIIRHSFHVCIIPLFACSRFTPFHSHFAKHRMKRERKMLVPVDPMTPDLTQNAPVLRNYCNHNVLLRLLRAHVSHFAPMSSLIASPPITLSPFVENTVQRTKESSSTLPSALTSS